VFWVALEALKKLFSFSASFFEVLVSFGFVVEVPINGRVDLLEC
jgi:hypothetical protein